MLKLGQDINKFTGYCKVWMKLLLSLCLITYTVTACSANPPGMQFRDHPNTYPAKNRQGPPGQFSGEASLQLFRNIIEKNITRSIGNNSESKSPAIAVGLVTEKGDITVVKGLRNVEKSLPANSDTLFGIGSVSKLFTALMLADAVANNDLALSDRANNVLARNMQTDDRITLQHLVSHFSGLPNLPGNVNKRSSAKASREILKIMPAKDYNKTDLTSCVKTSDCQPEFPPGKKYSYSNFGIGLLSNALQNHYGYKDFNSMNQARIAQVLNMHNTSTNVPDFLQKNSDDLAQGYLLENGSRLKPVPFSDMGVLDGSGELISSVNDMNQLLKMLTGLSDTPLNKASKEVKRKLGETEKPGMISAYANLVRPARDGEDIHFKSGLTAGYSAIVLWRDNPKVGMVLLANRGKFKPMLQMSNRLMEIITMQLQR